MFYHLSHFTTLKLGVCSPIQQQQQQQDYLEMEGREANLQAPPQPN
jgi:hypothetical protein